VPVRHVARVAHVIGVNPQRKLGAHLAHIVGGEHAAFPDLMLNSTADVNNPGRPETRGQHAPEIRYAVGQRVHVRPARHRRLRRHKLLL
jgi:hypothetical protein